MRNLMRALFLLLAASLSFGSMALAHDSWISRGLFRNANGEFCCGQVDCFVIPKERVVMTGEGYVIIQGPLAEARVIIDGAVAFTRDQNLNMAVVVVDAAGNLVSADKMDGTTINNTRFAEGKAFASAILRQTTEVLANLAKERPDRYFGIMNMYPGKVYLVGGGVPLTVDGRLVGAVGVAGLPQGVDEKAARAGIAAWDKFRENMKK